MSEFNRAEVIRNYYMATYALSAIGTVQDLPADLLEICVNALRATTKIIKWINQNQENENQDEITKLGSFTKDGVSGSIACRALIQSNQLGAKMSEVEGEVTKIEFQICDRLNNILVCKEVVSFEECVTSMNELKIMSCDHFKIRIFLENQEVEEQQFDYKGTRIDDFLNCKGGH